MRLGVDGLIICTGRAFGLVRVFGAAGDGYQKMDVWSGVSRSPKGLPRIS